MKELIEKIKKEIKKKIESYMDLQCDFEDHEMSYQEEILDNHYEGCKSGLETAIDIINKEAKSYNNGWIPCSERLPELTEGTEFFKQSKCCLTTLKWWDGDMTESVGWYNQSGAWNEDSKNCKVVAWMPLPEPFTPKEGRE